jgi:outer membrane lipoprotein LolB
MTAWFRSQKFIGLIFSTFFAINFIAGCAVNTPDKAINNIENGIKNDSKPVFNRQGRISLRVEANSAQPAQSLYGAFIISGNAQAGELTLNSPLGNTVAKLTWSPQSAELTANNATTRYPSTDALLTAVTGTALPLAALFDWLVGVNTPIEGWEADVSRVLSPENARLTAKRNTPAPSVDLRIVLEQP